MWSLFSFSLAGIKKMKLTIKQTFTYYHGGCNPTVYEEGQEVEVEDEEMIDVATSEGWAAEAKKTKSTKV